MLDFNPAFIIYNKLFLYLQKINKKHIIEYN